MSSLSWWRRVSRSAIIPSYLLNNQSLYPTAVAPSVVANAEVTAAAVVAVAWLPSWQPDESFVVPTTLPLAKRFARRGSANFHNNSYGLSPLN